MGTADRPPGQDLSRRRPEPERVRLDKWLQVARVFKTRSQATRACNLSRVRVNGETAKPHRLLAEADRIEVRLGDRTRVLVVRGLRDKPVPKAVAATLYEDKSPPRPRRDDLRALMRRPLIQREPGQGRPTKKERRELERLQRRLKHDPEP